MEKREAQGVADAVKIIGVGLVGAGMALLLAPHSGKHTRSALVRYVRTFGGRTPHAVYDFSSSIAEFIDSLGEKANEILNSGTDMSDNAKRELLTALERGQERLERQKRKLVQMLG